MKKWINTICSAVASLLTFIFLALPVWKTSNELINISFNGYKLISGKYEGEVFFTNMVTDKNVAAWSAYRIFAIILIVLAVLLAVYAIVSLVLNIMNIKVAGLDIAGKILLSVTVVIALVALICCMRINNGMIKGSDYSVKEFMKLAQLDKFGTQVGLWLVTIFNAIACASAWILSAVLKEKK